MAEWRVNLHGDEFDLQQLTAMLTSQDIRIQRNDGGSYFLTSDRLNNLGDARAVWDAAKNILQPLNGGVRLRLKTLKLLSVGNVQRIDEAGKKYEYLITESESLSIRESQGILKVDKDGTTETIQQEDSLRSWLSLALADKTVERVLSLYGNVVQTWKDLYPIYEIIESDVGGEAALVSKGWTSRNQIERFTRTANHSQAGGEDSRHAVPKGEPPKNPMTPAEGGAFIESLLNQWLVFKENQLRT